MNSTSPLLRKNLDAFLTARLYSLYNARIEQNDRLNKIKNIIHIINSFILVILLFQIASISKFKGQDNAANIVYIIEYSLDEWCWFYLCILGLCTSIRLTNTYNVLVKLFHNMNNDLSPEQHIELIESIIHSPIIQGLEKKDEISFIESEIIAQTIETHAVVLYKFFHQLDKLKNASSSLDHLVQDIKGWIKKVVIMFIY